MAGKVYDVADEYKARLMAREADAAAVIARAYRSARRRLLRRMLDVVAGLPQARSDQNWRFAAIERYEEELAEVRAAVRTFAAIAAAEVAAAQADAVELGVQAAGDYAEAVGIGTRWARVPAEALQNLVGTLQDGSPLRELFDEFPADAAGAGRSVLEGSVAAGIGPREAARQLAAALELDAPPEGLAAELLGRTGRIQDRALVIMRTETLRSHRSAALENYQANDDVVEGWEWASARDARTCPVCLAMDGRTFALDDPFASHVQCRCAALPWFEGLEGRGTGEEWFARRPRSEQLEILGPGKLELYDEGSIGLDDLVREYDDARWGKQRVERSLRSIVDELGG